MTVTYRIKPAGYIVTDNEAIWGTGVAASEAWADMLREMSMAGTYVVDDDYAEGGDDDGIWNCPSRISASQFTIRPASAALIEMARDAGGDCGWRVVGGVCVTRDEGDAMSELMAGDDDA
jgi:hypothetical protein